MAFPSDGGKKIYSCNEGNLSSWDPQLHDTVKWYKENKYSGTVHEHLRLRHSH